MDLPPTHWNTTQCMEANVDYGMQLAFQLATLALPSSIPSLKPRGQRRCPKPLANRRRTCSGAERLADRGEADGL